MGFFDKLKDGLKKTKEAVFGQVNEVIKVFRKVDEELLEELEEIMIASDMGVATTEKIIDEATARPIRRPRTFFFSRRICSSGVSTFFRGAGFFSFSSSGCFGICTTVPGFTG